MNIKNKKKILIAPLDWGLGHAVRDIPLINELIGAGYEIIIAGSGSSLELLKAEFPTFKHYKLPSASINYSGKGSFFILKMMLQVPKFVLNINRERKELKSIIKKENIELIISDNRYGIYSKSIPSIFISHQIFLKLPKQYRIFEKFISNIQKNYIHKFDKCLIPDFEGRINLSGNLSHKLKLSNFYHYIGVLSRFIKTEQTCNKKYDIIAIMSGPEPQRTLFYNRLYNQIKESGKKSLIALGKPDENIAINDENIEVVNHLSAKQLQEAILSSEVVITRAGYTSIMDLLSLRKKAILIPTPGQTEQLYLADYLKDKSLFVFETQNNFNLKRALELLNDLEPDFSIFNQVQKESFLEIIKSFK